MNSAQYRNPMDQRRLPAMKCWIFYVCAVIDHLYQQTMAMVCRLDYCCLNRKMVVPTTMFASNQVTTRKAGDRWAFVIQIHAWKDTRQLRRLKSSWCSLMYSESTQSMPSTAWMHNLWAKNLIPQTRIPSSMILSMKQIHCDFGRTKTVGEAAASYFCVQTSSYGHEPFPLKARCN